MRIDYMQQDLYHPVLKQVVVWIESEGLLPDELVQTSGYRPARPGTHSTHGTIPCRAMDLRCYDDELGKDVQDMVNRTWIYDPERPQLRVCLYHDTGEGRHLHVQVHEHTRRRQPGE